jgi:hypothetical protein
MSKIPVVYCVFYVTEIKGSGIYYHPFGVHRTRQGAEAEVKRLRERLVEGAQLEVQRLMVEE